jgi:hypothetical protein
MAGPRLAAAAGTCRELYAAVTFRAEWRWRIPATRRLAAVTPLTSLDHRQLSVVAGQMCRTHCGGIIPAALVTGSYGLLHAGKVTVADSGGQTLTLTAGSTWSPRHTLLHASRRAVLIHISAHEIRQLSSAAAGL